MITVALAAVCLGCDVAALVGAPSAPTVEHEANAVGLTPEDLVAEAEAWAAAQGAES